MFPNDPENEMPNDSWIPKESRYDFVSSVLAAVRRIRCGSVLEEPIQWAARYAEPGQIEACLDPIPLDPWQRDLMLAWARGDANLVAVN